MSRRQDTVPVTTGILAPAFVIENWPAIETACKFKSEIPKNAREQIREKTWSYLGLQKMEAEAIPLADQIKDLGDIAKATEGLRERLVPVRKFLALDEHREAAIARCEVDRGAQLMHRLQPCFDEVDSFRSVRVGERRRLRDFAREMEVLCSLLTSLENAAIKAAEKTRDEKHDLQLKGDAWDRWIAQIHKIVTDCALAPTTRNDTDKRAAIETPFLRLVKELQKLLPKAARRPEHSDAALAKAIQRAIEKRRHPPKLDAA
jgi:hypothetical protein